MTKEEFDLWQRALDRRAELYQKELDLMRKLLYEVQWSGADSEGDARCPCCGAFRDAGHNGVCRLAAHLIHFTPERKVL